MVIDNIIRFAKTHYDEDARRHLRTLQTGKLNGLDRMVSKVLFGRDLRKLAKWYGSDKWGAHSYASHYMTHFKDLRKQKLRILEIGIGGYDDPAFGGGSLRMWRTYFPHAHVFGIDIYDKSLLDGWRITTLKGSQDDPDFLKQVVERMGGVDIIIDDGSHINQHVITTFGYLFPFLSDGGWYIIEDTQTSYWNSMGGKSPMEQDSSTTMGFMKDLIDGLNYEEYEAADYHASDYDKCIVGMNFYHNIVFIRKGRNQEGSNRPEQKLARVNATTQT